MNKIVEFGNCPSEDKLKMKTKAFKMESQESASYMTYRGRPPPNQEKAE